MGSRFYKEPSDMPKSKIFNSRIEQLLNKPLPLDDRQRLCPQTLHLSDEAKKLWIEFYNEVEAELKTIGDFYKIKDFAAKSAENAVRLAGVFHIFCDELGDIVNVETMQRAISIMTWHLQETKRLLGKHKKSPTEQDAQLLIKWMEDKGHYEIKLSDILQLAPIRLRDKDNRDVAISILIQQGYLKIEERSGTKYAVLIKEDNYNDF